ncbi:pentatricopeptide repeat-containing protein At3g06430, chloroplastic-like isoform X2 [Solanum stenotomum]|uniref:pentatricopeptide repeat-containing protein At3g06430, chloroplastic-like isoform X2 n=1 Tax=Solanum stenotomum TaxID=172797 RepID=UPI0020D0AD9D|nr:pentatricopeptide repeat-containing protein At3g06430, chloroplastic-like isoform X2 [Solanum stenotomum]
MTRASFTLSSSSSLIPSPTSIGGRRRIITGAGVGLCCAVAATSSSSRIAFEKKKQWKEGEYPGFSEVSVSHLNNKKGRRTPINKKIHRKNTANPWVKSVPEALSDCIDKKQWQQALQVFEMLKKQPFYQPKEGTYMRLLVLLGRCGQPGQAQQLFDSMIEEGLEPTSELYTALIGAYCRSNILDKAFSLLHAMIDLPHCHPDVYTYSILIKACVDASRFDLVESLYEQMSYRSIVPNTVTQNIVLSGYGRASKYAEMEKVLLGMLESADSKPDVWTMNTILSIFGNKGLIEMMERWYEKIRNFGIEPETRTFNILIGAYGKKKMYDKMSSVMEYMRKLSYPWTTSTYNNVIEAFSDAGEAKHMEYTFDQMRAEGMKADTKTFCCLVRGYANAGLFHKAEDVMEMERVFKRMKDKQCRPDLMTYSPMINAYQKEGMTDKVYDLEQEKLMMVAIHSNDSHNDEEKLELLPT